MLVKKPTKAVPYADFDKEYDILIGIIRKTLGDYHFLYLKMDVLRENILQAFEVKNTLRQVLQLDDSFRRTIVIEDNSLLTTDPLFICLDTYLWKNNLVPDVDCAGRNILGMVLENKITLDKQTYKFSRHLNKIINKAEFEQSTPFTNLNKKHHKWESFIASLFEAVGNLRKTVLITANPLDLLLSSLEASFDSCYSLNDLHANGNLAHIRDRHTSMVAIIPSDIQNYPFLKHGRAWLYTDNFFKRFVLGRVYGTICEPQVDQIISYIGSLLASYHQIQNKWHVRRTLRYTQQRLINIGYFGADHELFAPYFDLQIARYVFHPSMRQTGQEMATLPTFTFPKARCLQCNEETNHNTHLLCKPCGGGLETCGKCKQVQPEMVKINDTFYCLDDFQTTYMVCSHCCESKLIKGARTLYDQSLICADCYFDHYGVCGVCGGTTLEVEMEVDGSKNRCKRCAVSNR